MPSHEQLQAEATQPPLDQAMSLVLSCWRELETHRPIGMSVGPIPLGDVRRWAREVAGLDADAEQLLVEVIRGLDADFLAGIASKQKG